MALAKQHRIVVQVVLAQEQAFRQFVGRVQKAMVGCDRHAGAWRVGAHALGDRDQLVHALVARIEHIAFGGELLPRRVDLVVIQVHDLAGLEQLLAVGGRHVQIRRGTQGTTRRRGLLQHRLALDRRTRGHIIEQHGARFHVERHGLMRQQRRHAHLGN